MTLAEWSILEGGTPENTVGRRSEVGAHSLRARCDSPVENRDSIPVAKKKGDGIAIGSVKIPDALYAQVAHIRVHA